MLQFSLYYSKAKFFKKTANQDLSQEPGTLLEHLKASASFRVDSCIDVGTYFSGTYEELCCSFPFIVVMQTFVQNQSARTFEEHLTQFAISFGIKC